MHITSSTNENKKEEIILIHGFILLLNFSVFVNNDIWLNLYFKSKFVQIKQMHICNKIKQYLHRPGQALRVPGGWGSQISRQSTHEGDKVVSPKHQPPLHPESIHVTHFCYRLSRTEGQSAAGLIRSMKNPNKKIEPATFRLVAQCLNELRYDIPQAIKYKY
jgi:hypothetical protein